MPGRWIGRLRGTTRRAGASSPERTLAVQVDDERIRGGGPDAEGWSIGWAELERVEIRTTDEGPFADDVFWMLQTASAAHEVPQGIPGERELFERLQALPGFDNGAVIAAMGSTENRSWVCWERRA